MKPMVCVRITLLLFHYYMSSPSSALQEHCAKNMNQFPNSVKKISNFFARAARPVSTGNFFYFPLLFPCLLSTFGRLRPLPVRLLLPHSGGDAPPRRRVRLQDPLAQGRGAGEGLPVRQRPGMKQCQRDFHGFSLRLQFC